MDLSLFSGQESQSNRASSATTSLTDAQIEVIRQKLVAGKRHNVFPNKFDASKPFRVSVQYDGRWNNFGSFSNIEVATCVAAVASVSYYGKAANTGVFDSIIAQSHPEWVAWALENEQVCVAASEKRGV